MEFSELKVSNFGEANISDRITFVSKSINFRPEPYIYEALNCLFNPNYINDRVTKPNEGPENNSYIEVQSLSPSFRIKRMLNNCKCVYVKNAKMNLMEWNELVRRMNFISLEPLVTTPQSVVKAQLNEMFFNDKATKTLIEEVRMQIMDYQRGSPNLPEGLKENIAEDNKSLNIIHGMLYLAAGDHADNCEMIYKEILQESFWKNQQEPKTLKSLWEICNRYLRSKMITIEKENCNQVIKILEKNRADTNISNTLLQLPYKVARIDQLLIRIERNNHLKSYADNLTTFFINDNSFIRKYKTFIGNESSSSINYRRTREEQFYNVLQEKSRDVLLEQDEVSAAILSTTINVRRLVNMLNELQNDNDNVIRVFEGIQSECLNDEIHLNSQYLPELLNDVSIENTHIKPGIIGLLHVMNLNLDHQVHLLFQNLNLNKHPKSDLLECCLAPFSNVLYYNKSEEVSDIQLIIESTEMSDTETLYIFAGLDAIERNNTRDKSGRFMKICDDRANIGYTKEMANLLSHLFMHQHTGDVYLSANRNWIFDSDKNCLYSDGKEMFPCEYKRFFGLLRLQQALFSKFGNNLRDSAERFNEIQSMVASMITNKTLLHQTESELRSEEIKLRSLRHTLINNRMLLTTIQCLLSRSKYRLINYDKLLELEDLDQLEEAIDVEFKRSVSQQTEDILPLLLQDVSTENISDGRLIYRDAVYPNASTINHQTELIDRLKATLNTWPQVEESDTCKEITDLCESVAIDFDRLNYLRTDMLRFNIIRKLCRDEIEKIRDRQVEYQQRNESFDLDEQIDVGMDSLNYVKTDWKWLRRYSEQLQNIQLEEKVIQNNLNWIYNGYGAQNPTQQLQQICNELTRFMSAVHKNSTIQVHCDLGTVDLNSTDWSRHTVKDIRALQHIRFKLMNKYGPIMHRHIDDLYLSTVFYILWTQNFGTSTVIINKLFNEMSSDEKQAICRSLSRLSVPRFMLVCADPSILE